MADGFEQLSLGDYVPRPRPDRLPVPSLDERYAQWRQTDNGRAIYAAVLRRTYRLKRAGWSHYGIKAICEAVRFLRDMAVGPDVEGFRLNNNYPSRMAREIMDMHPELSGFFETRDLRS